MAQVGGKTVEKDMEIKIEKMIITLNADINNDNNDNNDNSNNDITIMIMIKMLIIIIMIVKKS